MTTVRYTTAGTHTFTVPYPGSDSDRRIEPWQTMSL